MSSDGLAPAPKMTRSQGLWQRFCRFMIKAFYRRVEFSGLENIPSHGSVIFCANHVNALVDAAVVQAASPRPIHPLARSGLFRSPFLRPILAMIQAVPIYRRRPDSSEGTPGSSPAAATAEKNQDSFRLCYEYLQEHRAILIFPEGQSHSDPRLRALKTGAARLALGAHAHHGQLPQLIPVGLTFTRKGYFRGNVLVQFGEAVDFAMQPPESEEPEQPPTEEIVRQLTEAIGKGLESVTLNVDSWEDLALLKLLQGFFDFRKSRKPSLGERFRTLHGLSQTHRRLRLLVPERIAELRTKLQRFERLCRRFGVQDYHLRLQYRPWTVARFALHCLSFAFFVVPLAAWGFVHSAVPYYLTRLVSRHIARGRDQYDTAGMVFGLFFFLVFWGLQVGTVFWFWGTTPAVLYGLSLPWTAAIAAKVAHERRRILENIRVFFLFMRQSEVRGYLQLKRSELEVELAKLARLVR